MGQDSRLKKQIACKGDILWHTWYLSEIRDIYHMMGMGIAWDLSKAGFLFLRQNRLFPKNCQFLPTLGEDLGEYWGSEGGLFPPI